MPQHQMEVMDPTGHLTIKWSPDSEEEITAARETFRAMRDLGYNAFRVTGSDNKGERLKFFRSHSREDDPHSAACRGLEMPLWINVNNTNSIYYTTCATGSTVCGNASVVCGGVYYTITTTSSSAAGTAPSPVVYYQRPPVAVESHHTSQRRALQKHPQEARDRARQLLLSHLTPEQRQTFESNRWFVVQGGKSGRRYRIKDTDDLVANIDVLDGDRVDHRICAHAPIDRFPLHDHLLAQKIMIECEEEQMLKIANRHAA